ncbi:hypothetical protein R1flu_016808 [Riccia fluitans]|uniref:Uncharacterized protein n=1 Tax=Riccia fluitans TaxID=41844 RepID=A0ABD1YRT5_9MARC
MFARVKRVPTVPGAKLSTLDMNDSKSRENLPFSFRSWQMLIEEKHRGSQEAICRSASHDGVYTIRYLRSSVLGNLGARRDGIQGGRLFQIYYEKHQRGDNTECRMSAGA